MERQRPCPVCGNWRWRHEDVPDDDGHHPDCGVNLRQQRRARGEHFPRDRRRRDRRDGAGT